MVKSRLQSSHKCGGVASCCPSRKEHLSVRVDMGSRVIPSNDTSYAAPPETYFGEELTCQDGGHAQ